MEGMRRFLIPLPDNLRGVPIGYLKKEDEEGYDGFNLTSSSKHILLKERDGSYRPISEREASTFFHAKSGERIIPKYLQVGKTYPVYLLSDMNMVFEEPELLQACL
ncbi:MAG: hypothetical protein IJ215_05085 [Clostridia bacterium]|nr:hypothetical protein [Clostridia bacterium]